MEKTYTVQKIQELIRLTDQGSTEKYLRISATSQGGTAFTLDIPASVTDTKEVARFLEARAKQLDAIKGL
ncbi:MAG: hypothetical protein MUP81_04550 [Dehalococcoidia bacterium]|nr:hypothetical protein [Dehalococcoidia bacterium]